MKIMPHNKTLGRLARAARPRQPLITITASPWWTRVLLAAGAQRSSASDSMAVSFAASEAAPPMPDPGESGDSDLSSQEARDFPLARGGTSVLRLRTYGDATIIAEQFRDGTAVLMDLTQVKNHDAMRLIDFAAGLVMGLRGTMHRVSNRVFMLRAAEPPGGIENYEAFQDHGDYEDYEDYEDYDEEQINWVLQVDDLPPSGGTQVHPAEDHESQGRRPT
jgi:hypothetical protein